MPAFDLHWRGFLQRLGILLEPHLPTAKRCETEYRFALQELEQRRLLSVAPDGSFGVSGIVTQEFHQGGNAAASSVLVQADGKLVVAGHPGVYRYLTDGTLDASFGTNGLAEFGGHIYGVTLQSDGKIVATGVSPNDTQFRVVRYNTDGSLDPSFGGNGVAFLSISGTPADVRLQGDGKIVVGGTSGSYGAADFAVARLNANGSLDTSFGSGGIQVTDFDGSIDEAHALAIQPDGKIVLAGSAYISGSYVGVVRYNSDGSPDTAFSDDGKTAFTVGNLTNAARAVSLQPDEKLLIGGYSVSSTTMTSDFAVARLNTNGSLDTSFDGDGKVSLDFSGNLNDQVFDLAQQSDGKIVLAGSSFAGALGTSYRDAALARLNADGTLDTSFSADAKTTIAFSSRDDQVNGLAIQGDGNIVVAGWAMDPVSGFSKLAVARLQAAGELDNSFDSDGLVLVSTTLGNDGFIRQTIMPDGRILAIGTANSQFVLARFLSNGVLDVTFDNDGFLTGAPVAGFVATDITTQADGKIVVCGYRTNGSNDDFTTIRFNTNGSLDTSFDNDGWISTAIGAGHDQAARVVVQSDGKILVAGTAYGGVVNTLDFAVARYNSNGTPDTTFDGDGFVRISAAESQQVMDLLIQADGKIAVVGSSINSSRSFGGASTTSSSRIRIVRLLANGTLDTSFDNDGTYIDPNIRPGSVLAVHGALQSDGKIVVASNTVTSDPDFYLIRLNANGTLDTTFDLDGATQIDIGGTANFPTDAGLQPDGKIVVIARSSSGGLELLRLKPDGSLDETFDDDGKASLASLPSAQLTLQPDGLLLIGGSMLVGATNDLAFARLISAVTPSDIQLSRSDIDENVDASSPVAVGTLFTAIGDRFTYTVTGGQDQAAFSIGGANGDQLLLTDGILDFETQSEYQVEVTSTNSIGESTSKLLSVRVNDLPEGRDLRLLNAHFYGDRIDIAYEILNSSAPVFELELKGSNGSAYGSGNTQLVSFTINSAADRTVGVHSKSFGLSDGTSILLPGRGIAVPTTEYSIWAVLDSTNSVSEVDSDPIQEDNLARVTGGYTGAGGTLFVYGAADDRITLFDGRVETQVAGQLQQFNGISRVFMQSYEGSDVVSFAPFGDTLPVSVFVTSSSTATLRIFGNDANEVAALYPDNGSLVGGAHSLRWSGARRIFVSSIGGSDTALFYDSINDDQFVSTTTSAYLSSSEYFAQTYGYRTRRAFSTLGNDAAVLSDSSQDDVWVATDGYAYLGGGGFFTQVDGFDSKTVYGSNGLDRAFMHDTAGDDRFFAGRDQASMSKVSIVNDFDEVTAIASAGGHDDAVLWGSELFVSDGAWAHILAGVSLYRFAYGFEFVRAVSAAEANSRAVLYGTASNETFLASATYAYLQGTVTLRQADGFSQVTAYSGGGQDFAYFHDSAGDDVYSVSTSQGMLYGNGFTNRGVGFKNYYGYSRNGGADRAYVADSSGDDQIFIELSSSALLNALHYLSAEAFEEVYFAGTTGGSDEVIDLRLSPAQRRKHTVAFRIP